MEFAVEVWDPGANKHTQILEMVQNRVTCFISNINGRDGVTREKDKLGLVSLLERRMMQRMKTLFYVMESGGLCFKEDRPNTRAKVKGHLLAITSN